MGLSRRQFTKEFKLAAVRRLEQGVSIGEAARALEVNPNVLHRWRREFRLGPGNVFPGTENSAGRDMDLRDAIQRIALECLSYGRPRITAARAGRGGWSIPNGCTPPPTSEYQTNPIPKTNTTPSGSRQRRVPFRVSWPPPGLTLRAAARLPELAACSRSP
ncbi:MAG: transposase [Bryobacteraceae bacterium]|jgi:transposase-like protein